MNPSLHVMKYRLGLKSRSIFHMHFEYEIYYFHSGQSSYMIGGKLIELVPGDLIIMNGTREHGLVAADHEESDPCIRTIVLFESSSVQAIQQWASTMNLLEPFHVLHNYRWHLNNEERLEIEGILSRMDKYYSRNDPVGRNRTGISFSELLFFIYECYQKVKDFQPPSVPNKEKTVQKIMAYIETHYMYDLNIEELAGTMHLSRFYLMKIFRESAGTTIFDYINKRRINQAKLLFLQDKSRLITDVCFQVGFKHLSHFSRKFKQLVGLSPGQYRKIL